VLVVLRVDLGVRACDGVYVVAGGEFAVVAGADAVVVVGRALINAYLG
jgi:hypothetical protein